MLIWLRSRQNVLKGSNKRSIGWRQTPRLYRSEMFISRLKWRKCQITSKAVWI